MAAPAAMRTVENVAASTVPRPSATRVSTELPANATRAPDVHTAVRPSIFIGACPSPWALGEPGKRQVAILEDTDGQEVAWRKRAELARHAKRHVPRSDEGNLFLANRVGMAAYQFGDLPEFGQGRDGRRL